MTLRTIALALLFMCAINNATAQWQYSGIGSEEEFTMMEGDTISLSIGSDFLSQLYGTSDSLLTGPNKSWVLPHNVNDGYQISIGFIAKPVGGYAYAEIVVIMEGSIATRPITDRIRIYPGAEKVTGNTPFFAGPAFAEGAQLKIICLEGAAVIRSADCYIEKTTDATDLILQTETSSTSLISTETLSIPNNTGLPGAVFELVSIEHDGGIMLATVQSVTASIVEVKLFRVDAVGWSQPATVNYRIRRPFD